MTLGPTMLRQWLTSNDVSVRELARRTGINKNRLARALRSGELRVDAAAAIEAVTGIPIKCWH